MSTPVREIHQRGHIVTQQSVYEGSERIRALHTQGILSRADVEASDKAISKHGDDAIERQLERFSLRQANKEAARRDKKS